MQVGSSTTLATQLQALGNAAAGKFQAGQDFSFLLEMENGTVSDARGSSPGAPTDIDSASVGASQGYGLSMSGSFKSESLVAVGTMGTGGHMTPFSSQQVQGEEAALGLAGKSAYANALQNFLALSQAGGQIGGTTLNDKEQFVADNGLISGTFNTSLSLSSD